MSKEIHFLHVFLMVLVSLFLITMFFLLLFWLLILPDSILDVKLCEIGMSSTLQDGDSNLVCFANDDMDKLNVGRNIKCECFFATSRGYELIGRGITSRRFIVGEGRR